MQEEGNVPLNKVYLLKVTLLIFSRKKRIKKVMNILDNFFYNQTLVSLQVKMQRVVVLHCFVILFIK